MNFLNPFIIAQLFFSLFIGFWIARRMREMIRAMVLKLMPVHKRISEESFDIQTRKSAILAFIVGLGIASLMFWGMNWARLKFKNKWVKKQEIISLPIKPEQEEEPALPGSYGISDSTEHILPADEKVKRAVSSKEKEAKPKIKESPKKQPQFYFQIAAFQQENNAWKRKETLEARYNDRIYVASLSKVSVRRRAYCN